jgi:hypothetical protein
VRNSYKEARKELDRQLDEYAVGLAELRRARRLTQGQVAMGMGVSQAQVSRVENQADFYLSTLRNFVDAMGGELRIMVAFPDMQEPVEIDLKELAGTDPASTTTDSSVAGRPHEAPMSMGSGQVKVFGGGAEPFDAAWGGNRLWPLVTAGEGMVHLSRLAQGKTGRLMREPAATRESEAVRHQLEIDERFEEITSNA